MAASFEIANLSAWYGNKLAIEDMSLSVEPNQVTALIGPSGCGKSTLVRCLNRLHELIPGARAEGKVVLDGENIYDAGVDPVAVRRAVGMVFQRPNPFPTMSILDNTIAGFKLNGRKPKAELLDLVQRALTAAGLWEEEGPAGRSRDRADRKSTRLNSSHSQISYAVFCLKKKKRITLISLAPITPSLSIYLTVAIPHFQAGPTRPRLPSRFNAVVPRPGGHGVTYYGVSCV